MIRAVPVVALVALIIVPFGSTTAADAARPAERPTSAAAVAALARPATAQGARVDAQLLPVSTTGSQLHQHALAVTTSTPDVPTDLAIEGGVDCNGTLYANSSTPRLLARATTSDQSATVNIYFQIAGQPAVTSPPITASSGVLTAWTAPTLVDGTYSFRAQAGSASSGPVQLSAFSAPVTFVVDTVPPGTPTVTPTTAPPTGRNQLGKFYLVLTLADSPDTVGFTYTFSSAGAELLPISTTCSYAQPVGSSGFVAATGGRAVIAVPASLGSGPHTIYVEAFDAAHQVSAETSYAWFGSSDPPPLGGPPTALTPASHPARYRPNR